MFRMRILAVFLVAASLVAGDPAPPAGPTGIVLAARGKAFAGLMVFAARGLSVAGATLPWDEIAAVGMPVASPGSIDGGVITLGGEILRGRPLGVEKGVLRFSSDLFGALNLPLAKVAAVVLSPLAYEDLPRLTSADPGAVLANGDRVKGSLAFLNPEAAGIDTGRRVAQVPRARVVLLVLARQPEPKQESKLRVWFLLASGDRLCADSVQPGEGGVAIDGGFGKAVLPAGGISACWGDGGGIVPLTRLMPLRLTASDRLGNVLPVVVGRGFPAFAGLAAANGLHLPARGEVAWVVDGGSSFLGWVAVSPNAGSGTARVVADGKVVWERFLQRGQPPVPVEVTLRGVHELCLRSDPGGDGEAGTHGVSWFHPVLVQ